MAFAASLEVLHYTDIYACLVETPHSFEVALLV